MPERPEALVAARYRILSRLGEGATGAVDLAQDQLLGCKVAIKRFSADQRDRAAREASVLAAVRFPGVVRLVDAACDPQDGAFLAVFEHLDGLDLFRATEGLALPLIADALADVLRALRFVHGRGLVHRDLKSDNILVHTLPAVDGGRGVQRATVIDFGLAAPESAQGGAGTVAYLAPEVFAGAPSDVRSDLYSLGVVIYQVLARRLPSEGLSSVETARLHSTLDLALPDSAAARVPAEIADLVRTLLRRDPALRPGSAAEVMGALSRALDRTFDLETPETLEGRSLSVAMPLPERVTQKLLRALRSPDDALAIRCQAGGLSELLALRIAAAGAGVATRWHRVGGGTSLPESPPPSPWIIEVSEEADRAERAAARSFIEGRLAAGASVVVAFVGDHEDVLPPGVPVLKMEPDEPAQIQVAVREALGVDVPRARMRSLSGMDGFAPRAVRGGLVAAVRAGFLASDGDAVRWVGDRGRERIADPAEVRVACEALAGLPLHDRSILAAIGCSPIDLPVEVVVAAAGASGEDVDRLAALGLVEISERRVGVRSDALALAFASATGHPPLLSAEQATAVYAAVADGLLKDPETGPGLRGEAAILLASVRRGADALPVLIESGIALRTAGRAADARRYLARALSLCRGEEPPGLRLRALRWLADCDSLEGRNVEAARRLEEAIGLDGAVDDLGASRAVLARTRLRLGDHDRALQDLVAGLALAGLSPPTRALLLTTKSMVLRDLRRFAEAAEAAAGALLAAGPAPSLERGAAMMTLSICQVELGRSDAAIESLREAAELGRALRRPDMSAFAVANLGRLLLERGESGAAVSALMPLADEFEADGAARQAEAIFVTLLMGLASIGDIQRARALITRGREHFSAGGSRHLLAMFLRHAAETELRAGNVGGAEGAIRESLELRDAVAPVESRAVGRAMLARVLLWKGDPAGARVALAEALRLLRAHGTRDSDAALEVLLVANEHALAAGRHALVGRRLARPRFAAAGLRRAPLIATAELLRVRCLWRAGREGEASDLARSAAARFRLDDAPAEAAWLAAIGALTDKEPAAVLERCLASLAAEGRALERARVLLVRARWRAGGTHVDGLELAARVSLARDDVAEAERIAVALACAPLRGSVVLTRSALGPRSGGDGDGDPSFAMADLHRRLTSMERLLEINKAINSELDPRRLLHVILDEAISLCGARRGFLVLISGAAVDVRVARNFAEQDIQHPEFEFSHSVARDVARNGQPIHASNALHDHRLRSIASIHELRVLSILCVPLRSRDQTLGSIYLDHPDVIDRFDEGDLTVLTDFAWAAGIALERARLYQENLDHARELERANQEIERLNQELRAEVEEQARELTEVKDEMAADRRAAERRYDYRNIISQSAVMEDVLRLLDRITDTDLPVLILGESGTGKELVARAIHYNGPRKAKNFVSVNCAAMAESLIEAELFGYMKGAFTGADRDRKGLFEIADQGTLFLDEVGDMSLEVQKRLLRVVQLGEFYRVGGKEPIQVNVRIISATHRDLREMIRTGEYREDLFYRIHVAPVLLPPLRDRTEDIPLLVDHFLAELARDSGLPLRQVSPAAQELLARFPWPGNVRELQNEVKRLLFLRTDDPVIDVPDLPATIREHGGAAAGIPDGSSLKDMMDGHERALLVRTLSESHGNKTEAARRLGISLRGLYKAMQRLDIGGTAGRDG